MSERPRVAPGSGRLRVAFLGSPAFAVPTLRALLEAGHDVAAVYSQPPRPAGRGQAPRRCPVHEAAEALGLPVRTPGCGAIPTRRRRSRPWGSMSPWSPPTG